MPPKGSKRASTAPPSEKPEKVAKKAIAHKCAEVTKEIGKLESMPESCRTMLMALAEPALSTYAAERHAFQVQGVEMVAKTLATIEAELTSSISQEEAKVNSSDSEKAKRASALSAAETKFTELQQAVSSAKEAVEADTTAEKAAKAEVAKAKEGLKEKEDELADDKQKKISLESARSLYDPVKTSKFTGQEGRKSLNTIQKVLKEFELEEFLVTSIAEAAGKEMDERGTFDGIVVKHIDEKLSEWTVATDASIKAGETLKVELTNSQAAAEQHNIAAMEKLTASKAALETATAAVAEGKSAFKEAEVAVKSFEKEIKLSGKKLEEVKAALESFKEGALKAFADLKELAPPPVPEPVPEEEAAPTPQEAAEFQPID